MDLEVDIYLEKYSKVISHGNRFNIRLKNFPLHVLSCSKRLKVCNLINLNNFLHHFISDSLKCRNFIYFQRKKKKRQKAMI